MEKCESCFFFFKIPPDADDYESGKADCVNEKKDEKGKYWLSKPVYASNDACNLYKKRITT